jgi:hypothetical protein
LTSRISIAEVKYSYIFDPELAPNVEGECIEKIYQEVNEANGKRGLNYLPLQQGLVVLESTDIVFLFKVLVTIGMDQFYGIDGLSC